MFNMKKEPSVITISEMKKYIFEKGYIPNPMYTQGNETEHIALPRGTIFSGKKRYKPLKF